MSINVLLSSLSLFSSFIYIMIGFYAFKQNIKSIIHKFFLLLCISYCIWSFAYSFAYISQDKYNFSFWNKVSAIGWCSFSAIALYFVLLITENKILKKSIIKIIIFLPAFFFYFIAAFLFGPDINTLQIISNIFYIGDFLYNFIYLSISILLVFIWGLKTNNKIVKKQANILVISCIIPFILNLITQTILPIFTKTKLPLIGQLYSVIMIIGIYIVVTKYKFLKPPDNSIIEEIMNEMLDMVIIVDDKGQILRISKHMLVILGYKDEAIYKKNIDFIFDEKDKSKFSIEKLYQKNIKYDDIKILTENNQEIPVNVTCKQIIDSRVNVILGFVFIFQDISIIYKLKRMNEEIFNEKERFKITLLSVSDGVISTDKRGNVEFVNKVGEQLTGWTIDEAYNIPLENVLSIIDELTGDKSENPVYEVIKNEKITEINKQAILISKEGLKTLIDYSASPIKDEDGKIGGVVLVFRDYKEKKEKQEKIEYLSYHDQLTGVYNRRFYEEELKCLDIDTNLPLSIILADVNGLKLVNDSFGHAVGDELIKRAAEVLKKGCRNSDIIARIGGDEFIVILPKADEYDTEKIVKQFKQLALKEKIGAIDLSVSFGYKTKRNKNVNITEILKKADDHMYRNKLSESPRMRNKAIYSIIRTLHKNSDSEQQHSISVSELCERFANELHCSFDEIEELKTAGLLHDIGKIAIKGNILNKVDRLSKDEWEEIRRHPEIGYRMLSTTNKMSDVAEYILAHHERWDGYGYPKGLKGLEIPLQSRIISIVDAYDSMVSERCYRCALDKEFAIEELMINAGTQFDPELVGIFIDKILKEQIKTTKAFQRGWS